MSTVLLPQPTTNGPDGVNRYRAAILTLEPERRGGSTAHVLMATYDFSKPFTAQDPAPTLAGVVRQLKEGAVFRVSPHVRAELTEILAAQDRRHGEDTGVWVERMAKEACEPSD